MTLKDVPWVYSIETDAEKGFPAPDPSQDDSWQKQTTLGLLVFALLLWLINYVIVVTATLYFKSVESFSGTFGGIVVNVSALVYKDTLILT